MLSIGLKMLNIRPKTLSIRPKTLSIRLQTLSIWPPGTFGVQISTLNIRRAALMKKPCTTVGWIKSSTRARGRGRRVWTMYGPFSWRLQISTLLAIKKSARSLSRGRAFKFRTQLRRRNIWSKLTLRNTYYRLPTVYNVFPLLFGRVGFVIASRGGQDSGTHNISFQY